MPTKCKYCDEQVSLLKLLVTRLFTGSFPECPNCGADAVSKISRELNSEEDTLTV